MLLKCLDVVFWEDGDLALHSQKKSKAGVGKLKTFHTQWDIKSLKEGAGKGQSIGRELLGVDGGGAVERVYGEIYNKKVGRNVSVVRFMQQWEANCPLHDGISGGLVSTMS